MLSREILNSHTVPTLRQEISKTNFKGAIEEDIPSTIFGFFGNFILVIIGIVLICANLQNAINYTFNPQYYVLQEVIDMVKTLKQ